MILFKLLIRPHGEIRSHTATPIAHRNSDRTPQLRSHTATTEAGAASGHTGSIDADPHDDCGFET